MGELPVYNGPFGQVQAERLLWRAGFGVRPDEAYQYSKLGLHGAVHRLTNPGPEKLRGPKPQDDRNRPLAPYDAWGHDHAWWLDRMVRTNRPLTERMTLIWHDWFATSIDGVGSQKLMLLQNQLFRTHGMGSFHDLLLRVTTNPAMLIWLNGVDNRSGSPNENYAREMMELFSLGADRGAYTEDDVREQARALTGWTNSWSKSKGAYNFRFRKGLHDGGLKTIFGKTGHFTWKDSVRLCVANPKHASFFVTKLWSYFVPVPPDAHTQRALERLYVSSGHQIKPVVAAILLHPQLYKGPRMMKSPVVYTAGLMRRLGRRIDTISYVWLNDLAGQRLFEPPNVAGWDESRWLDTATFRGRWMTATEILSKSAINPDKKHHEKVAPSAQAIVKNALAHWHNPQLGPESMAALHDFANRAMALADEDWKRVTYPLLAANAARALIAASPEMQAA
jgi:uncharacterized protein (DUF1800 family)